MCLRGAAAPLGLPASYGSGKYKNAKKVLQKGNNHLDIFGLSRAIETFRKYFYREQWLVPLITEKNKATSYLMASEDNICCSF